MTYYHLVCNQTEMSWWVVPDVAVSHPLPSPSPEMRPRQAAVNFCCKGCIRFLRVFDENTVCVLQPKPSRIYHTAGKEDFLCIFAT